MKQPQTNARTTTKSLFMGFGAGPRCSADRQRGGALELQTGKMSGIPTGHDNESRALPNETTLRKRTYSTWPAWLAGAWRQVAVLWYAHGHIRSAGGRREEPWGPARPSSSAVELAVGRLVTSRKRAVGWLRWRRPARCSDRSRSKRSEVTQNVNNSLDNCKGSTMGKLLAVEQVTALMSGECRKDGKNLIAEGVVRSLRSVSGPCGLILT
jgi:hypothetical protein